MQTLELDVTAVAKISGQIYLTKFQLIDLWEKDVLNTTAYVYLACEMDKARIEESGNIDIDSFCESWIGTGTGEKKPKELKETDLRKALTDLQKKGLIELGDRQLQIQFV